MSLLSRLSADGNPHHAMTLNDVDEEFSAEFFEFMQMMENSIGVTQRKIGEVAKCEYALAFSAFSFWRKLFSGSRDISGAAREAAYLTMQVVNLTIPIRLLIRGQRQDFRSDRELELAADPRSGTANMAEWGPSVTRFVIIGCRTLAFALTRQVGSLDRIETLTPLGLDMFEHSLLCSAFGQAPAQQLRQALARATEVLTTES